MECFNIEMRVSELVELTLEFSARKVAEVTGLAVVGLLIDDDVLV